MANLIPPRGLTLENLLWAPSPSADDEIDKPLPNIAVFDRLHEEGEPDRLRWLADWIEHHTTCAHILRHHGPKGLKRVIRGIAKACSKHGVHMGTRVSGFAQSLGLQLY